MKRITVIINEGKQPEVFVESDDQSGNIITPPEFNLALRHLKVAYATHRREYSLRCRLEQESARKEQTNGPR